MLFKAFAISALTASALAFQASSPNNVARSNSDIITGFELAPRDGTPYIPISHEVSRRSQHQNLRRLPSVDENGIDRRAFNLGAILVTLEDIIGKLAGDLKPVIASVETLVQDINKVKKGGDVSKLVTDLEKTFKQIEKLMTKAVGDLTGVAFGIGIKSTKTQTVTKAKVAKTLQTLTKQISNIISLIGSITTSGAKGTGSSTLALVKTELKLIYTLIGQVALPVLEDASDLLGPLESLLNSNGLGFLLKLLESLL